MGETAPFWNFSAASYPDLERAVPNGAVVPKNNGSLNGNTSTSSGVYISESVLCSYFSSVKLYQISMIVQNSSFLYL